MHFKKQTKNVIFFNIFKVESSCNLRDLLTNRMKLEKSPTPPFFWSNFHTPYEERLSIFLFASACIFWSGRFLQPSHDWPISPQNQRRESSSSFDLETYRLQLTKKNLGTYINKNVYYSEKCSSIISIKYIVYYINILNIKYRLKICKKKLFPQILNLHILYILNL